MKIILGVILLALATLIAATYVTDLSGGSSTGGPGTTDGEARPQDGVDPGSPSSSTGTPQVPQGSGDGPAAGGPPAPGAGETVQAPRDPLQQGMAAIIEDLVTGRASKGDAPELVDRLVLLLEEEGLGDTTTRREVAEATLDEVIGQLAESAPSSGTGMAGGMASRYISSLARDIAQTMRGQLSSGRGSRQHTGTLMQSVQFEAPEGYKRLSWDTLGGFEYREGMELPAGVKDLDGKKVAIAGYMITLAEVEDIHEFLLVESGWSCCFGVPPDVNQVLEVRIPEDAQGVEFTTMPVVLAGTLDVGEQVEDGFVISVYRMTADSVRDAVQ